jgi:hypothetical protein
MSHLLLFPKNVALSHFYNFSGAGESFTLSSHLYKAATPSISLKTHGNNRDMGIF